jgi:ATP-binding cassette subfamily C (CFTR/MRP) protein 10
MTEKDKRVKLMSEIIRGIRVIKYHVWEKYFIDKVSSMCIIFIILL